ncbi:hypothetical protein [Leptospira kirschneri]|uniref:hypothetical protein n=1 Tax=Leptospira kirschneri TaxID=29507 RepID=UPI0015917372|nr:hypothetical protein [Leptospira kirschneri]
MRNLCANCEDCVRILELILTDLYDKMVWILREIQCLDKKFVVKSVVKVNSV